jgi:uncharacterized phage protein gp47/JayE
MVSLMVAIVNVTPTYGISTNDVTIEITGSGFTALSSVTLISPTSPPTTYSILGITYLDSTKIRATLVANSIPLGIYDIQVNTDPDSYTLSQAYRSTVALVSPYSNQTLSVLRARVRSRMGNAPNGKPYDLRTGSNISNLIDAPLPEIEIYYDRLWRILKQGFAQYTGGILLRLRAEEHGVIAKPAVAASGVVKTTAPAGTILPTGMTFSTTTTPNSNLPAINFTSTEAASKTQKNSVTGTVTSATATTAVDTTKNFTTNEWTGHYFWITNGTGTGQVRKVLSNTATTITVIGWDQGAQPDATSVYQLFSGVDVQADVTGSGSNIAAAAINVLTSRTAFVTAVTNPITFISGLDAETDAQLLARYLLTVRSPSSGGNVTDYKRWAQATPGVSIGDTSVIPLWNGNGTVKLVILNADGSIPGAAIVSAVQQYIDPSSAGLGGGVAPIGAVVTVVAATAVPIDVSVVLTITAGYNAALVRSQVQTAIINYINQVGVGQNVIFTQVQHTILHDPAEYNMNRLGVSDYDILSTGHGIKRSSSGTWLQANVTLAGTEKATAGTITVS